MAALSEQQQEAVKTIEGQVLVISCPGSGKTTVMVSRTANLIKHGVHPDNILVITFTKEAATQLKNRFEKNYGKTTVFFGTIHSICYRVIQRAFGYRREDILLESEQWDFFRQLLYRKVETDDFEDYVKKLLGEISYVRNCEISVAGYKPQNSKKEIFLKAFDAYEEYKRNLGKIDFDDMLIFCRKCFREMPEELRFWKDRFKYIMIDEFQDTNSIQADIFYMLAGKNGNIFVVGDDDQSIYGFRSADSDIMLDFPKIYPDAKVIHMSTNYRSEPDIIKYAAKLIGHNEKRFKKQFLANKDGRSRISVCAYDDMYGQADDVLEKIKMLHKEGVGYNQMAVLYRTNSQNQIPMGLLMEEDIPFYSTEPPKDYHAEFMFGDFMAYYRLSAGCWEKGDVQRILNRPSRYLKSDYFKNLPYEEKALLDACKRMGAQSSRAMVQIFDMENDIKKLKGKRPFDFINTLLFIIGYDKFIDQFTEFCQKDKNHVHQILDMLRAEAARFDSMEDWKAYAEFYAKELQKKKRDKRKEGVCFSTFHSAKGLEWDVVFIIDAAEDYSPYVKAETPEDFEEERRLFYVAMTRARNSLYMSYAVGRDKKTTCSRYIAEMGFPKKQIVAVQKANKQDLSAKPTVKRNKK